MVQGDSSLKDFHSDLFSRLDFPRQENMVTSGGGVFNTEVISDRSIFYKTYKDELLKKNFRKFLIISKLQLQQIIKYIGN